MNRNHAPSSLKLKLDTRSISYAPTDSELPRIMCYISPKQFRTQTDCFGPNFGQHQWNSLGKSQNPWTTLNETVIIVIKVELINSCWFIWIKKLQQNASRQSSDMWSTVNKWTLQQGEQIHAKNRKIYNFDLKLSITIFRA